MHGREPRVVPHWRAHHSFRWAVAACASAPHAFHQERDPSVPSKRSRAKLCAPRGAVTVILRIVKAGFSRLPFQPGISPTSPSVCSVNWSGLGCARVLANRFASDSKWLLAFRMLDRVLLRLIFPLQLLLRLLFFPMRRPKRHRGPGREKRRAPHFEVC